MFHERPEALEAAGLREKAISRENVEIVREWLGSVMDSEDFAWHLLAPDAELINATGAPFTNASGHEGFRAWRAEVSDAFEEWSSRPEKVVDAGNAKVLALGKISGRGTGLQVDMELHSLYTLVDGKITRVEGFFSRHEALEAAGLRGR